MVTGWMIYGGFVFIVSVLLINEVVKDEENYWFKLNAGLLAMTLFGFVYDSMNAEYYGIYLVALFVALNFTGFVVQLTKASGRKKLIQLLAHWQQRLEAH